MARNRVPPINRPFDTPLSLIFCAGASALQSARRSKREAKAAPNGAGAPRLGVVGTVDPARLRFSLLGALVRPQQALASVHTAALALCTCTRNRADWSVCAVVRAISVGGGGPVRVYGSLAPA